MGTREDTKITELQAHGRGYPGRLRIFTMCLGVLLACVAFFAHRVGLSASPQLGPLKALILLVGACTFFFGAIARGTPARRFYDRLILASGSLYMALFCGELALVLLSRTDNDAGDYTRAVKSMKGLYRANDFPGFGNTPNWQGVFDDGVVRCDISINSLGARDDKPAGEDTNIRRIMLLGDSFTFGYCLDQTQTIDKHIEELTGGNVEAYNLGVNGYGPGDTLEVFKAADWWHGSDVLYLFFHNDLREDNSNPGIHTAFGGFVVPRLKSDGTLHSEDEYQEMVDKIEHARRDQNRLKAFVTRIKDAAILAAIRERVRILFGSDEGIIQGSAKKYRRVYIDLAVDYTQQMKELATERGARFHVVIIPSKGESRFRRYASITAKYVKLGREREIGMVELLEHLSLKDYFEHDGHFSPAGAKVTAKVIVDTLGL